MCFSVVFCITFFSPSYYRLFVYMYSTLIFHLSTSPSVAPSILDEVIFAMFVIWIVKCMAANISHNSMCMYAESGCETNEIIIFCWQWYLVHMERWNDATEWAIHTYIKIKKVQRGTQRHPIICVLFCCSSSCMEICESTATFIVTHSRPMKKRTHVRIQKPR